ncbi:FecR family protein [Sphingomonas sp.]|uniref:FecR family protein n=1 Tax=Sphingomonas sp. TaxID=28214 RepID=UPI002CC7CE9A|nr:FecR domain-containing protein [Sphingomonas sp.]HTG38412.1 FecR domain-containing protein [Sphingomonas sp.]
MTARSEPENANRQAAEWLARLHADDRGPRDDAAFRRWLAAHPRHADAFEQASAVWEAVGGIGVVEAPSQPVRLSRRAVMAGGAAAIVAGGATLGWREANAGVYRTDIGEQRRVRLDDGTRVMLDTATRIRFRAGSDARFLSLTAGRIDLEVAADPRPFVIEAGDRAARLRRGRVDVRHDDGRTAFTAIDGALAIGGGAGTLAAAHRITLASGFPDRIDRPELDDLTAWQSGRLAFRDETLAGAAAEMNRYTTRPLLVGDDAAAAMRLSGLYRAGDPEAFARSVALLLPVRVEADDQSVRIFAER